MPGVLVVGAVNVDMVVTAPTLPSAGETVVGPGVERHGGGKGANAAVAASRAGATVTYIGAVGDDDLGRSALAELRADGVIVDNVEVITRCPTGVALIVVDENGENQIAVGGGANSALSVEHVHEAVSASLPETGCLLVSTEIPDRAVAVAVELAIAAGVPCLLNPAPVTPVVHQLVGSGAILTPNRGELAALTPSELAGADRTIEQAVVRARALASRSRAPVVTTLGAEGSLLVTATGDAERVPPLPATVRDTTGAGDTFNGVLAARLARGTALRAAVADANAAAALSVAMLGARAGMPTDGEIDAARAGL
ncbi:MULTISPECIES: ribokinase [Pseudonocardia]|uniref:Ribokinase n=2 Tax=Pseudonocardia TaxID=1847 RepID=A0A1Y2MNQ8_PSEAH|nr:MULTISPECIES: ribokinase [Pseudonocardia]OSY36883.1 Ribokinase [Pseudonocardia autotrophica]TDN76873.1 ribokinase [Pseudonocardia autotrophica]BBG00875.1 ribokinase [Pseudonocardia autotrophica]GEC28858.1 ribokinase [Pseudonocardia saturnea]